MVKKIMRDPLFLAQKSVDATEADKQVITDLLDTLRANLDHCVGMAANMIGVKKNIIVVASGPFQFAMVNPVITKKTGAYQVEEGCLSLDGTRPCTRWDIVIYQLRWMYIIMYMMIEYKMRLKSSKESWLYNNDLKPVKRENG